MKDSSHLFGCTFFFFQSTKHNINIIEKKQVVCELETETQDNSGICKVFYLQEISVGELNSLTILLLLSFEPHMLDLKYSPFWGFICGNFFKKHLPVLLSISISNFSHSMKSSENSFAFNFQIKECHNEILRIKNGCEL